MLEIFWVLTTDLRCFYLFMISPMLSRYKCWIFDTQLCSSPTCAQIPPATPIHHSRRCVYDHAIYASSYNYKEKTQLVNIEPKKIIKINYTECVQIAQQRPTKYKFGIEDFTQTRDIVFSHLGFRQISKGYKTFSYKQCFQNLF